VDKVSQKQQTVQYELLTLLDRPKKAVVTETQKQQAIQGEIMQTVGRVGKVSVDRMTQKQRRHNVRN
jgi:hypothetical protein